MSFMVEVVVYLGVITDKFLEHCTTFETSASLVLVVEMADVNFHTDCSPGRRIIDDLQRQSHEKPRRKTPACLS